MIPPEVLQVKDCEVCRDVLISKDKSYCRNCRINGRGLAKTLNNIFREAYTIGLLSPAVQAEHRLIERYWDTASERLRARHAEIQVEAREAQSEFFGKMIRRNPFMWAIENQKRSIYDCYAIPTIFSVPMKTATEVAQDTSNKLSFRQLWRSVVRKLGKR